MPDIIIYAGLVWVGYLFGSITGWIAGVNNLEKQTVTVKPSNNKPLCTDYSHLKNSPAGLKAMSKRSLTYMHNQELYEKIYEAEIIEDEYKVSKVNKVI